MYKAQERGGLSGEVPSHLHLALQVCFCTASTVSGSSTGLIWLQQAHANLNADSSHVLAYVTVPQHEECT